MLTGETAYAGSFNHGIPYDVTAGTIDLRPFSGPSIFLLVGFVQWDANATGNRMLRTHDGSGGSNLYSQVGPKASGGISVTFSYVWRISGSSGDNLRMQVHQNSGGDLDIDRFRFSAFRMR